MKKQNKKSIMFAIVAAVVLLAVIIVAVCVHHNIKKEEDAIRAMSCEEYRMLYRLKNTEPDDRTSVDQILTLTHYYKENANPTRWEMVWEREKTGLSIALAPTSPFPTQKEEVGRQVSVLLALIPDIDFVVYRQEGLQELRWQQSEIAEKDVPYIAESDETYAVYTKDGYAFQRFMDDLIPVYRGDNLHDVVKQVLLEQAKKTFPDEECAVEGHRIVNAVSDDGLTRLYVVYSVNSYRFINGQLTQMGKTDPRPALFALSKRADGMYQFEHADFHYSWVSYEDAVREMFVQEYAERTLGNHKEILSALVQEEIAQATAYVASLGRTNPVGTFSDLELTRLSNMGVSEQTLDIILSDEALLPYPMWVGTQEFVENGIRYVYETSYQNSDDSILLKKYEYNSKTIADQRKISAK